MSLGNDLWLNCSISSIDGTDARRYNWSQDVVAGGPRVSPVGQNVSPVKVYPLVSDEQKIQNSYLPAIPTRGLFDDFYEQCDLYRQWQLANAEPSSPPCQPTARTCTSSRWIMVYEFPQHQLDTVLHHFLTLGRVCDKRIPNDGNYFYLCYAHSLDCLHAEKHAALLPQGINARVEHCTDVPPIALSQASPCDMVGTFPIRPVYQHWGRDFIDIKKRYNPHIFD